MKVISWKPDQKENLKHLPQKHPFPPKVQSSDWKSLSAEHSESRCHQSRLNTCYLVFMSRKTWVWKWLLAKLAVRAWPCCPIQYSENTLKWTCPWHCPCTALVTLVARLSITQFCLFPLEYLLVSYPQIGSTKCHPELWIYVHASSSESWPKLHIRALWLLNILWSLAWILARKVLAHWCFLTFTHVNHKKIWRYMLILTGLDLSSRHVHFQMKRLQNRYMPLYPLLLALGAHTYLILHYF